MIRTPVWRYLGTPVDLGSADDRTQRAPSVGSRSWGGLDARSEGPSKAELVVQLSTAPPTSHRPKGLSRPGARHSSWPCGSPPALRSSSERSASVGRRADRQAQ